MFLGITIDGGVNAGRTSYVPPPIMNSSSIDFMFFHCSISMTTTRSTLPNTKSIDPKVAMVSPTLIYLQNLFI